MLQLQHHDPMPDIVAAGRPIVKSPFDSVSESLFKGGEISNHSESNKSHRRFGLHHGIQKRFGVELDKNSDNAFSLLHNMELSDIGQYFMDKKESIYISHQKKPLGRVPKGHELPQKVHETDFRFGFGSEQSEPVGQMLFPFNSTALYRKTDPEYNENSKNRHERNWGSSNIDPETYRFGAPAAYRNDSAAELLSPKRPLLIGMRRREDHKAAYQHVVGRSTRLTKATRELSGQAFGLPSRAANSEQNWGAKECLTGFNIMQNLDNSSKVRPNCTNIIAAGTPSIQTNRKPPRVRSLANTINYGDCPKAHELLYPPKFSSNGIMDDDFSSHQHLEDLRQLFDGAGMKVSDDEFMEIKKKIGSPS